MDEVHGITAIDSLYERIGLEAAGQVAGLLLRFGLPFLIVLVSTAWLFFRGAQEGSYRHAFVYFFSALLVWFLLSPVGVVVPGKRGPRRFQSPRLVVHLNAILDRMLGAATGEFSVLRRELGRDRAAFMLSNLRITDGDLRRRVKTFLRDCTGPEILAREREGMHTQEYLLFPLWVANFDRLAPHHARSCAKRHEAVGEAVRAHLESRGDVRAFLQESGKESVMIAFVRKLVDSSGLGRGDVSVSSYLQNVAVARLWSAGGGDLARAEASTGGSLWELASKEKHNTLPLPRTDGLAEGAIALHSRVSMELDARAKRFEVMLHAPKFYGLALMLVLAGFPLAMMFALLPGGWRALVNFGKIFLSVKMWPLFWNLLSVFNDLTDTPDARLVLPSVYLAIPLVSFMLVNVVSGASGAAFRMHAGAGLSPGGAAGAVLSVVK